MDISKIVDILSQVQQDAALILEAIPATQVEGALVASLGGLVTKALTAYQEAAGTTITADSIAALMPAPIVLDPPKA